MSLFGGNSSFSKGIYKLVQMLYAGMLWFLCSLPVVTAGAATAALFEVFLKLEKDQESYIGREFFRAFRVNGKKAVRVWLPLLVAEIIFGVNLFYYGVLGGSEFLVQGIVFAVLLLLTLAVAGYAFPVMARFENTIRGTFRMAFILAIQNPGWTVAILMIQIAALFVCWYFLFFPSLFIMGIAGYMQAAVFNHIFDSYIQRGKIIENNGKL